MLYIQGKHSGGGKGAVEDNGGGDGSNCDTLDCANLIELDSLSVCCIGLC